MVQAAAGGWCSVVLTSTHEVFTFGGGWYGQLGLGDGVQVASQPVPRIVAGLQGKRIV